MRDPELGDEHDLEDEHMGDLVDLHDMPWLSMLIGVSFFSILQKSFVWKYDFL